MANQETYRGVRPRRIRMVHRDRQDLDGSQRERRDGRLRGYQPVRKDRRTVEQTDLRKRRKQAYRQ